jgi:hypothetical protein
MRKLWNRSHWRHTPTRPPSADYYQAFNVPIRRSAVALLWTGIRRHRPEINTKAGAAKARGWRWRSRQIRVDGPGIPPDSAAGPGHAGWPIKASALAGNNRQQAELGSATFALAQALIICSLPHRRQNRKCLQIVQQMTFLWSGCIRSGHERYRVW